VLKRPSDALANSQLGMTHFLLGNPAPAEKHLLDAVRLDPAHFSRPQLFLAEIYLRQGDRERAAAQLESFLAAHPNWADRAKITEQITQLRAK
jgi:Tfp pilus assembly protein PilF